MAFTQKAWQKTLEVLFPRICMSCPKYIPNSEGEGLLCHQCFESIEVLQEDPSAMVHSIGLYTSKPLRNLIRGLKFRRYMQAMGQIEKLIQKYLEKNPDSVLKTYDLITFVPLHTKKQRGRGFNQSELVARALGDNLGIEVKPTLEKVRNTRDQSSIENYPSRAENVYGCFARINIPLLGRRIILVDDVYTSGYTTREATRILEGFEPAEVVTLTLSTVRKPILLSS